MQSFLGSLNYYSRFIEDFAVYAAVLYELREADFHEIVQQNRSIPGEQVAGALSREQKMLTVGSERITQAQDEEQWIANMKSYLRGEVTDLSSNDAKSCAKTACDYELDESGLLLYCRQNRNRTKAETPSRGWSSRRRYNKTSCIITTLAWKAGTKGSGGLTSGSRRTSTGEGCSGVFSGSCENVWIVKLGKGAPSFRENRQGMYKLRTHSK
ncbi:hypothetical protein KRP22_001554 [Phytophthora ramorum]|nr:hypothetical protein KRP22_7036 [Phytophthora ramorum]